MFTEKEAIYFVFVFGMEIVRKSTIVKMIIDSYERGSLHSHEIRH